jgi:hypothetical protein
MPPSAQSSTFVVADAPPPHAPAPAAAPPAPSVSPSEPVVSKQSRLGQMMVIGYLLLILGTAIIFNLPRYHMKAGFLEDSLVLASILFMLGGAGLVLWTFVRKMLREL